MDLAGVLFLTSITVGSQTNDFEGKCCGYEVCKHRDCRSKYLGCQNELQNPLMLTYLSIKMNLTHLCIKILCFFFHLKDNIFTVRQQNHIMTKNRLIARNFVTARVVYCCPNVFCNKSVFKNFSKFTVKYLCQSLCFNEVASFPYFLDQKLKKDKHC